MQLLRAGPEADPITFVEREPSLPGWSVTIHPEQFTVGPNGNGHHNGSIGGSPHQEATADDAPAAPKRSRTTDEQRAVIYRRYEAGDAVAAIADDLGIGRSTVFSIVSQAKRAGLIRDGVADHAATQ